MLISLSHIDYFVNRCSTALIRSNIDASNFEGTAAPSGKFFLAPRRRPIHDRALRRYGVQCELASVAQAADRAKIVCIFLNHENNINQRDSFSNPPKISITIMFADDNIYV